MGWVIVDKKAYREFFNSNEAYKWGFENYGDWIKELQRLHKIKADNNIANLLYYYTGNSNVIYNNYLRGRLELDEDEVSKYSNDISIIANKISEFKLNENIIVYRYTHKKLFKLLFNTLKISTGHEFCDKGFTSTTLVKDLLKDFAKNRKYNCLLKMYLPKGTVGAYVNYDDSSLNEQEFLLPPNSKFLLRKKHINFNLSYPVIYECELVSQ